MSKKAMIVTGGAVHRETALSLFEKNNFMCIIGVDSGLSFLDQEGIIPAYIVGDFDSVPKEVLDRFREEECEIIQYDAEKDASDTQLAIELALSLSPTEIYIVGATGTRLDHVLANIHCLKIALDAGVLTYMLDGYNRIRLLKEGLTLDRKEAFGDNFSLFPFGDKVEGLYIKGAKYPLNNHTLRTGESLGLSNTFLQDVVEITFSKGIVVLIESKDA